MLVLGLYRPVSIRKDVSNHTCQGIGILLVGSSVIFLPLSARVLPVAGVVRRLMVLQWLLLQSYLKLVLPYSQQVFG